MPQLWRKITLKSEKFVNEKYYSVVRNVFHFKAKNDKNRGAFEKYGSAGKVLIKG